MIIIFKLIVLTVICAMGIKIAMSKGMLLEKVGEWAERKLEQGHKWVDLIYCEWCSSTIQTITAHLFAFGLGILPFELNWQLLIRYPLIVMGSSFVAGNLWNVYITMNKIKENNEAQAEYFKNLNDGVQPQEQNGE